MKVTSRKGESLHGGKLGGGVKAPEGGQAGEAVSSNVKALRPVFIEGRVQMKPMSRLLIGLIFIT